MEKIFFNTLKGVFVALLPFLAIMTVIGCGDMRPMMKPVVDAVTDKPIDTLPTMVDEAKDESDDLGVSLLPHDESTKYLATEEDLVLPIPSALALIPAKDSGVQGDNITNHTTITIAGKMSEAVPKGTQVQLYNNGVAIPDAVTTVARKNRWAVSATLPEGVHILTARSEKGGVSEPLKITIDTTDAGAVVDTHLDGDMLTIEVSGQDVVSYRYALVAGYFTGIDVPYGDSTSVMLVVEDVSLFPAGTFHLVVIGEDIAGNVQPTPSVVHLEKGVLKPIN